MAKQPGSFGEIREGKQSIKRPYDRRNLVLFCVVFLICASAAQAAQQVEERGRAARKITLSYSAVSMSWFPAKVAVAKGFFRDEGLDPQLVQMRGTVATAALAAGHIDFSLNISPVLNGAMQGLGLKLAAVFTSRPLFSLVVRPEIQSAADLKGKVIAINSFGNTQAILTEKHLEHLGLKKGDYQLIALGETSARLAAMGKNLAQASLMPPPANVQMESRGYRMMGNTAEIVVQPISGLGTQEERIRREPELVKRAIRAGLRGLQFVLANPAEATKIIADWVRLPEKEAARVYDLCKAGLSKDGFASDESLNVEWSFIQRETKRSNVPVSVARDFSLLAEVQRELGLR